MVQVKLLGAVAVRVIFGSVPLQIVAVALVTDASIGYCYSKRSSIHVPVVEVVTIYSTVPALHYLGLLVID
jgi:ABC-type proline/glycine betaine transport system permease subunit